MAIHTTLHCLALLCVLVLMVSNTIKHETLIYMRGNSHAYWLCYLLVCTMDPDKRQFHSRAIKAKPSTA